MSEDEARKNFDQAMNMIYGWNETVRDTRAGGILMKKAAELGHPRAMSYMGCTYAFGDLFFLRDMKARRFWFLRAAHEKDPIALLEVYHFGMGRYEKNAESCAELLPLLRVEQDTDPLVLVVIAGAYALGIGVEKDREACNQCLELAIARGSSAAMLLYARRRESADKVQASQLYLDAAELGSCQAMFRYAMTAAEGVGITSGMDQKTRDEVTVKYLALSAEQQHSDALYHLACAFHDGVYGVECDVPLAAELYEKSSNLGHIDAPLRLFEIYSVQRYGLVDKVQAMRFLKIAAGRARAPNRELATWCHFQAHSHERAMYYYRKASGVWLGVAPAKEDVVVTVGKHMLSSQTFPIP